MAWASWSAGKKLNFTNLRKSVSVKLMAWQVTGNHPRDYKVEDGTRTVVHVLDPEMPEQHLPDFRGEIINCLIDPDVLEVEVDLDYGQLSASMLGTLVKAQRRAENAQKELIISHLSKEGQLILEATGLGGLFHLSEETL